MSINQQQKYLICAGEPSGDLLAADVVTAMKEFAPELQAYGVTGRNMEAAGAIPIARTDELTVMGFYDVLKKLPSLIQFEKRFLLNAVKVQPRFLILVDYPGLHLRFAKALRSQGFPIFQLVAPQLWAWKEKRVFAWKENIDYMLGVMPFEKTFFDKYDLPFQYVGTPQVDRVERTLQNTCPWPGVLSPKKKLGFFPGSRESEFKRMAPAFLKTISKLKTQGQYEYYFSIGPEISLDLAESILREHTPAKTLTRETREGFEFFKAAEITFLRGRSLELMKHVDSAVVTSGTATLECGLVGTPLCVVYKTNSLNYSIAKRVVTLPNIALVNIVAGKKLVQEFVQDLDPDALARELVKLTEDHHYRAEVEQSLAQLKNLVHGKMGRNTAQFILDYLTNHPA